MAYHPCCSFWRDDLAAGKPCPACRSSKAAAERNKESTPWGNPPPHGHEFPTAPTKP
jgi:hypothetical protein